MVFLILCYDNDWDRSSGSCCHGAQYFLSHKQRPRHCHLLISFVLIHCGNKIVGAGLNSWYRPSTYTNDEPVGGLCTQLFCLWIQINHAGRWGLNLLIWGNANRTGPVATNGMLLWMRSSRWWFLLVKNNTRVNWLKRNNDEGIYKNNLLYYRLFVCIYKMRTVAKSHTPASM